MSYRWLEHTSELELHIDGPTETAVFELALAAMAELAGGNNSQAVEGVDGERDGEREGERVVREVTAAGSDRAALLAAFLEELVYLLETDDLVPERAEHLKLAGNSLTATVRGHRGRPRHLIKGVTYHELMFAPADHGFVARVVLDV
jgi:SHS2 domain-containing protein